MSEDRIAAATDLVLAVFRVNGLLLAAGDDLTGREGLTSARWQVLGAVALADRPPSVPQVARRMGLKRQSVQMSVNHLVADGMLAAGANTEHRRSPVFTLTGRGASAYARLGADQEAWIGRLTDGLSVADLAAASRVLREIAGRLA
jgi:DNA-binding MarR family transcriptional regulator